MKINQNNPELRSNDFPVFGTKQFLKQISKRKDYTVIYDRDTNSILAHYQDEPYPAHYYELSTTNLLRLVDIEFVLSIILNKNVELVR